jgi:MFS family permease
MLQPLFSRWYFGWNIVAASAIITLLTTGMRLGIGPFMLPVTAELGMTRTMFSAIVAISMIVYGIGMPIAGYLSSRYNTRFILLLGVSLITVSILLTIAIPTTLGFFAGFGVLLSLGLSFTSPVAVTPIISRWFTRQRGRALFYLSTGSMAGIAIMNPVEVFLIDWIGWKLTLLFFAVLFLLLVVPASLWIMRDDAPAGTDFPQETSQQVKQTTIAEPNLTWNDAVRTPAFWQICFGLFACGFSMNLLGSHGVPMLVDHHFPATTAAYGIGLIGFVAIFTTILLGSVADRFPRKNLLFWVYAIRGLGFLGLVYAMTPWQLYAVAATGGLVWAGSIALSSAILSDLYGVRLMGLLYGWAYFGHQIGAAIGSFLGGWGYETFGTHAFSFSLTTILLILAGVVSYRLPLHLSFPRLLPDQKAVPTNPS